MCVCVGGGGGGREGRERERERGGVVNGSIASSPPPPPPENLKLYIVFVYSLLENFKICSVFVKLYSTLILLHG